MIGEICLRVLRFWSCRRGYKWSDCLFQNVFRSAASTMSYSTESRTSHFSTTMASATTRVLKVQHNSCNLPHAVLHNIQSEESQYQCLTSPSFQRLRKVASTKCICPRNPQQGSDASIAYDVVRLSVLSTCSPSASAQFHSSLSDQPEVPKRFSWSPSPRHGTIRPYRNVS